MKPSTSLIVVANRSRGLIYKRLGLAESLELISSHDNPEGRISNRETTTDRPGTAFSSAPGHANTYASSADPKDEIAITFARSLSQQISRLRNEQPYDKLVLVAEPHMLGMLKAELDEQDRKHLSATINKDLANLEDHEIPRRILASAEL